MGKRVVIKASSLKSMGDVKAQNVLRSLRQLRDDLDELYMADEELYDSLDLSDLHDEVMGATMDLAHQLEG